jgi:3-oxoacyl-[acyl-carrier-protein] synthase III
MVDTSAPQLGIAAIATYEPPWVLRNEWFGDRIGRKFVHQTGIVSRPISEVDEESMALAAAANLQRDTNCDWRDCAGIVFASPSFVPLEVVRKYCDSQRAQQEHLPSAARRFAEHLGVATQHVYAINWFCSGYAKALEVALSAAPRVASLGENQFLLVINASRISRITDFGCAQTGPLFGDMATATLIARTDSRRYPPRLRILFAGAEKLAADGVYFDFHLRDNVPVPTIDGRHDLSEQRLVFTMNGMGVADTAPRAMASALERALQSTGIAAQDVRYVIPHQAGTGIVRLAAMKFDAKGVRGEVVNGLTTEVGNVSSCSIPYALKRMWNDLHGPVACPTAAVGSPGHPEMSHGCIVLDAGSAQQGLARVA